MRLLVVNTVHEPTLERVRRANPGKVVQRPEIAGKPLPAPAGRMVLTSDQLSAAVIDQLEELVRVGNVRVLEVGAREKTVDFDAIRARLRLPVRARGVTQDAVTIDEVQERSAAASTEPAPSPLPETVPASPAELATASSAVVAPVAEIAALLVEAPPAPAVDIVASTETWVAPPDLADTVRSSKNETLRSVLSVLGKSGTGKNKAKMVDEILEVLLGVDVDPVVALRAVEIVRVAPKEE